ncbi:MAG: hypothetical protein PHR43_02920 [Dehalococcoidales bacterium]|nr:hypothetical protein [Dehalococcoidales bacterium]
MKYQFAKPELTCVEIENELGLMRGDVTEVTVRADGAVEIEAGVELTAPQRSQLESLLGLKEIV